MAVEGGIEPPQNKDLESPALPTELLDQLEIHYTGTRKMSREDEKDFWSEYRNSNPDLRHGKPWFYR